MKTTLLPLVSLIALPALAHARTVTISTETTRYSAPASTHLTLLQDEIARKAIDVCGENKVIGIRSIRISIANSIDEQSDVASLRKAKFGYELNLNYPKIKSTAVVECAEDQP